MTCPACTHAQENPLSGMYQAKCPECQARGIAQSPQFWESSQANAMTPAYRSALQSVYGAEWKTGHDLVKKWSNLIAKNKGKS